MNHGTAVENVKRIIANARIFVSRFRNGGCSPNNKTNESSRDLPVDHRPQYQALQCKLLLLQRSISGRCLHPARASQGNDNGPTMSYHSIRNNWWLNLKVKFNLFRHSFLPHFGRCRLVVSATLFSVCFRGCCWAFPHWSPTAPCPRQGASSWCKPKWGRMASATSCNKIKGLYNV